MQKFRWTFLVAFLGLFLFAGAKKPEFTFTVHPQAKETDGEPFILPVQFINSGQSGFIGKMPLLTQREVASIYPFPVDDGTMGCAFYLDARGRSLLDSHTVEQRGKQVVVFFNGRQVIDLLIDKRIPDGLFVVPFGFTMDEIAVLEKHFPIKGQPARK